MMQHQDAVQRLGLAVALLPLGTANDFACTAGISVVRGRRRLVCMMLKLVCCCWALPMTLHAQQASLW
jgi:hypothetical protein